MRTRADPVASPDTQQQSVEERTRLLHNLRQQWDHTVRHWLQHPGEVLWPQGKGIGAGLVHPYRLRRQTVPDTCLWWVEHDIPPYDEYKCATYWVLLTLNGQNELALSVHSGTAMYPVTPLTEEALETALAQAGQDPPLVALREMGQAIS